MERFRQDRLRQVIDADKCLVVRMDFGSSVKWPEFGAEHQWFWSNMMKSRGCALIQSITFRQIPRVAPD